MSLLVMIPRSTPSGETTGRPETRYLAHSSSTSAIVVSGPQVTGLVIIPASERLTMSTWCAWSSIAMLGCRPPAPPCLAMATAMDASVTVSIAEDSNGSRSEIRLVSLAVVAASLGMNAERAGSKSTSSKVSAGDPNLASSVMSLPDAVLPVVVHPSYRRVAGSQPAGEGSEAGVLDDVVGNLQCPHCGNGLTRTGGALPPSPRRSFFNSHHGHFNLLSRGRSSDPRQTGRQ